MNASEGRHTGTTCRALFGALLAAAALAASAADLPADTAAPALGRPASPDEVAAHDTFVFPDGSGLPPGRGSVDEGRVLYARHCVTCHGEGGRGGPGGELAGGTRALTSDSPDLTIGTYWPYATTLFDFIRRAMPTTAPGSLPDTAVYALVAYLLHENGVVAADTVLDAAAIRAVRMPNRDGFLWIDAPAP